VEDLVSSLDVVLNTTISDVKYTINKSENVSNVDHIGEILKVNVVLKIIVKLMTKQTVTVLLAEMNSIL